MKLFVLTLTIVLSATCWAGDLVKVVRVIDGDTVVLSTGERVRLARIDAAELGTGQSATDAKRRLATLVEGQYVSLERKSKDLYRRTIGEVSVLGSNVSDSLLRSGLANPYSAGSQSHSFTLPASPLTRYQSSYRSTYSSPSGTLSSKSTRNTYSSTYSSPSSNLKLALPKTEYVGGYVKKDGTYVNGYLRAPTSSYSSTYKPYTSTHKPYTPSYNSYTPSYKPYTSTYKSYSSSSTKMPSFGSSYVRGYTRSNGTHVSGYYRSKRK